MIAEFPKGGCIPESNSAKAAKMDKARAAFVKACGAAPLGHFKTLHGTATITGVGFFDKRHPTPQRGRAPHDREIHPVLSFSAASCRAGDVGGAVELSPAGRVLPPLLPTESRYLSRCRGSRRWSGHGLQGGQRRCVSTASER